MRVERSSWDGTESRRWAERLRESVRGPADAAGEVARIVAEVRSRGDAALRELEARFDATELEPQNIAIRVDPGEVTAARSALDSGVAGALEVAARNVRSVAQAELETNIDFRVELAQGQAVSVVSRPVASAGVYAPGGRAAYPSSVLMCCVPARVAGVDRIAVATPPGPDGRVAASVLGACAIAGVDEVYAVGGAQAIAALAFGTESLVPVEAIAGPGNPYVNAAKRIVFGSVGLDGIAGPSELVCVLDVTAAADRLALDLLAQAEHGDDGLLAAISADRQALDLLAGALEAIGSGLASVHDATIHLVEAPDLGSAVELADAIAPEHLELAIESADAGLAAERVAGCVFFGPCGGAAFGDYAAGSNHVLPTGGAARFGGPLGVDAFRRRTSVVELSAEAAAGLAPRVGELARAEGFPVHADSAEARARD